MSTLEIVRVDGEPIIVATATGHISIETLLEVYRKTEELRKDMPKNIYRISNFSDVETSFTEMMGMIKQAAMRGGSSSTDPSVTVVFVATSHWAKLFADALRQGAFGGKQIPIFETLDEAFAFVHEDIAAKEESA